MSETSQAGVFVVRGSDDVLRGEAVTRLVDRLVGDGDRTLLVTEFDGPDYDLSAAVDAAQTMPFLTERRIVVVRHASRFGGGRSNADAAGDDEPLAEEGGSLDALYTYLRQPSATTDLVVVWEKVPLPGHRSKPFPPKLTKAVKSAGGEVITADAPGGRGAEAWVADQLAEHGLRLDADARRSLVERLGEDTGALIGVIERLLGVYGPGAKLGAGEVEPFLGEAGGVPPWELTDAVDRGDTALAMAKLQRMLGGGERHPLQLMSTLYAHYERILRLDGAPVTSEREAADLLGLKGSTFPARKALAQARRLGPVGVSRAMRLLADADLELRGAQAWPAGLVMEVLVARLCQLARLGQR